MRDSRFFSRRMEGLHGDPDDPLSWDELTAKAEGLTVNLPPADRMAEIVSIIRSLDMCSVTDLACLLVIVA